MTASAQSDQSYLSSRTALVYEITEEARLLLGGAGDELEQARIAASEAAYYLSDTIEPDDRTSLLAIAEQRLNPLPANGGSHPRAMEALELLADTEGEVKDMLRGPSASSELRIALQALRRAISAAASAVARGKGLREVRHADTSTRRHDARPRQRVQGQRRRNR